MQFRKAFASDANCIMNILSDGRRALAALGIDQWQGGYPYRSIIEADIADGNSYVVVDDEDKVRATVMMGFSGDPDYELIHEGYWLTDSIVDQPCYGVVHRVAVESDSSGQGVASFLFEKAEQLARTRGCKSVRVDTHPGNTPMRNLLLKRGYQECGIIYIVHAEQGIPQRIAYELLV